MDSKSVLVVAQLVLWIGIAIAIPWWFIRKRKKVSDKPTEELQEMISAPGQILAYGPAVRVLAERNEDYSAALPHLLDHCLAQKMAVRMVAWGTLVDYFPDIVEGVDFDYEKPSGDAIDQMNRLIEEYGGDAEVERDE